MVTTGNIPIVIGFWIITASQFALGMWMTILTGRKGRKPKFLGHGDRSRSMR